MQRDQRVVANTSALFNNDANNFNATCNTVGTVWTVVAGHPYTGFTDVSDCCVFAVSILGFTYSTSVNYWGITVKETGTVSIPLEWVWYVTCILVEDIEV